MSTVPREDLEHILKYTGDLWEELRDQNLFITGGTGFFGKWLLESFLWANDYYDLKANAVLLTRDLDAFQSKYPELSDHPAIHFHIGDVRSFVFPEKQFAYIIHAATSANAKMNEENPLLMFDTIVNGTRRVLDFAFQSGAKKILFTSSGAVYGRQPSTITHLPEDFLGCLDTVDAKSAYGEGKRAAELICTLFSLQHCIQIKIARCFAFVGPYLPLDQHYAVGNFIRDGIHNKPIRVNGDGTPYRSYLYAADLAIWLWKILLRGENCRPYNVGSEEAISISELAYLVSRSFTPHREVTIKMKPDHDAIPERYIPLTQRAHQELDLQTRISLEESIRKTIHWYRDT